MYLIFVEEIGFDEIEKPMILICPMDQYLTKNLTSAGLDNLIIQTSHQRSAPYTNLYTLTKRCYWLDSKIFCQPEFRNLSTPIKQPIACIQIQTGSLVLILVYIFNCIIPQDTEQLLDQQWQEKLFQSIIHNFFFVQSYLMAKIHNFHCFFFCKSNLPISCNRYPTAFSLYNLDSFSVTQNQNVHTFSLVNF